MIPTIEEAYKNCPPFASGAVPCVPQDVRSKVSLESCIANLSQHLDGDTMDRLERTLSEYLHRQGWYYFTRGAFFGAAEADAICREEYGDIL